MYFGKAEIKTFCTKSNINSCNNKSYPNEEQIPLREFTPNQSIPFKEQKKSLSGPFTESNFPKQATYKNFI